MNDANITKFVNFGIFPFQTAKPADQIQTLKTEARVHILKAQEHADIAMAMSLQIMKLEKEMLG